MSELIALNVITRSMFMEFKRSLNGNSIKKNNCACYRQVNPIFQSNLTFITIVNRPIGIDLQFDWTRKTATTKYKAIEIGEKETKALHEILSLCCSWRTSFATMVKIYGIPQLFEWTMNSKSFFHGTMIFSFSGLQFNNVQFTGSELIENSEHSQEWKLSLLWVWVGAFFHCHTKSSGITLCKMENEKYFCKENGRREKDSNHFRCISSSTKLFCARNTLPTQSSFFILSFSFNRNKNGVRIMTWHFLYLYFVVFNIAFLFFDDWIINQCGKFRRSL